MWPYFPVITRTFFLIPAALRRQQDGGFFKSPHYPGYPFLMIPDLTNPYLSNGSLSPSARTVSIPLWRVTHLCTLRIFFLLSHSAKKKRKKKKLWPCVKVPCALSARPPYSLRVASQGVLTTSLFFFFWGYTFLLLQPNHPPRQGLRLTTYNSAQSSDTLVILLCFEWFMAACLSKIPCSTHTGSWLYSLWCT